MDADRWQRWQAYRTSWLYTCRDAVHAARLPGYGMVDDIPYKSSTKVTVPLLLFSLAVAAYMLFHIIISPGHVLINDGGDAIKNYYTYLYQVLYGDGWHSMSMNYPFGEHVVYTDGQPLLAVVL